MKNVIGVLAALFFVVSLNAGTISGFTSVDFPVYTSASFPVSATLDFGPNGSWNGELAWSDTTGNFVVDIPKIVLPKGAILDHTFIDVNNVNVTNQLLFGNGFLQVNGTVATSANQPPQESFANWCIGGRGCSVPFEIKSTDTQIFGTYDVQFGTTTDPNGQGPPNSTLTISGDTSVVVNMSAIAEFHIDTPEPASLGYGFLGVGFVFLKLKYRRRAA